MAQPSRVSLSEAAAGGWSGSLASLADHLLGDNSGGVSFLMTKEASSVPEAGPGIVGVLALLGMSAFQFRRAKN